MGQIEHRDTVPLSPVYAQNEVNQSISFGSHPIMLKTGDDKYTGTAEVSMQFRTHAELIFEVQLGLEKEHWKLAAMMHSDREPEITLTATGARFKAFQGRVGRFKPNLSVIDATQAVTDIQRTVIHIFNFPHCHAPTDFVLVDRADNGDQRSAVVSNRMVLKADGWIITLCEIPNNKDNVDALGDRGGWLMTYVGEIVREDGSEYSSEKLDDISNCLQYFLSFLLGRWAGVSLPVGFGKTGDRIFESWGMPRAADGYWNPALAWFDAHHGEVLSEIFPGFVVLWKQAMWQKPLKDALYWYIGAVDRRVGIGVDTGLIIAQSALELLAWNYCVRDRKMISAKAFGVKGLSAADKVRLLLSFSNIPLAIPTHFRALNAKRGQPWTDSVEAITVIRNGLVHPGEDHQLPEMSDYEAWRISVWFIELIILRLCSFEGNYANRLWQSRFSGQVEAVPWKTGKT